MSHETTNRDRLRAPGRETAPSQPARTALYDVHRELGGKMVDFAGWQMPLQYPTGIMAEHRHCREQAALFDVSHMGQLELRGPSVAELLETLVPADIVNLPEGQARYTFFTNVTGGILDDLIVTDCGEHLYVVVNASMRARDVSHLRRHLDGCTVTELTDHALIAVQGPAAAEIVARHCPEAAGLRFMRSVRADVDGVSCRVSRLGYTGEDGYEISIPVRHAQATVRTLLAHENCRPAGLGARDSLRLEAGLCLYGTDIDADTTPVEASLLWAIPKRRREQGGFPGDSIIAGQIADGTARRRVGIRPEGRTPARRGVQVCDTDGTAVGEVTSGGFSPTLNAPIAMAYVDAAHAHTGTEVMMSVRGKLHPAAVSSTPFVPPNYCR